MTPTPREYEIAALAAPPGPQTRALAELLCSYREEVLRPFVELQKDAVAYRDQKAAKALEDLIRTARGVP